MFKSKATKLLVFATGLIVLAVFLGSSAFASSGKEFKHDSIVQDIVINGDSYTSRIIKTDFDFSVVGLAWQGSGRADFSLRYYSAGRWSKWYALESGNFIDKLSWHYLVEPVLANQASALQYKVSTPYSIDRVKVVYLTSRDKPRAGRDIFNWLFSAVRADESINIIKRGDWGANEDWRYDSQGNELWPAEHSWPQKFIIHHTAGSDGGQDPAGIIQGIYYWHAVVLGWGDIGYNYLVDQQGNIYEGRAGGDGVIGAHAYRSASCAKSKYGDGSLEANFNKGTIGIVVLGDYENELGPPNSKVMQSLEKLIAYKGKDFNIDPAGEGYFIDKNYPNVVGHRDVDCTDCPGKNLYGQLDTIRQAASQIFQEISGSEKMVYKASLVSLSEQPIKVPAGGQKEVWAEFRNEGNSVWRNYSPSSAISLVAVNSPSSLYVAGWESSTVVANLTTANVAPGDIGRFVFDIQGPADRLEVTEEFILRVNGQDIPDSRFKITALVTGLKYAGSLKEQTILPATFTGAIQTTVIKYLNEGTEAWQSGDVKLDVYDLGLKKSRYYDSSWPAENGEFNFQEASVEPGQEATFKVIFKSPDEPGLFLNVYRLSGNVPIAYIEDRSVTRVDSRYQAESAGQNMPPAVLNIWRPEVTIRMKNTGLASWDRSVGLQVLDYGGNISRFYDQSWDDVRIAAHLNEKLVKPGEIGSFTFRLHPPDEPGIFYDKFRVFKDGRPVPGGILSMITRVDIK